MRLFFKKIAYFIFIPVLIIVFMDCWLRSQDSLYSAKYKGALAAKDSIKILILGNSHANYAVDPDAFDWFAYNLANVNQSLYFDKRIALSLLDSLKQLKYVLISIDYHTLYFSSQGLLDNWSYFGNGIKYKNKHYLLPVISPFLFGYTPKVSVSLLRKRIRNYIRYNDKCLDFDVEEGVNPTDTIRKGFLGYHNKKHPEFFSPKKYQFRANYFHEQISNSREKEEVLADLDDFIYQLKERNLQPVLFTSPTYSEYNTMLDSAIINQNIEDIQTLCKKHSIDYFDFSSSERFVQDDFYNADHLNKRGAVKFSLLLNGELF